MKLILTTLNFKLVKLTRLKSTFKKKKKSSLTSGMFFIESKRLEVKYVKNVYLGGKL